MKSGGSHLACMKVGFQCIFSYYQYASCCKMVLTELVYLQQKNCYILVELFTINIQGVTGGTDQTLGECSLGQTIPI